MVRFQAGELASAFALLSEADETATALAAMNPARIDLLSVTVMRAQVKLGAKVTSLSSNLEEVRRMIIAGVGVGPLPVHVAARDVADGLLWQAPPFDRLPAIDVFVVWNPRAVKNRAEELLLSRLLDAISSTPIEDRTYS